MAGDVEVETDFVMNSGATEHEGEFVVWFSGGGDKSMVETSTLRPQGRSYACCECRKAAREGPSSRVAPNEESAVSKALKRGCKGPGLLVEQFSIRMKALFLTVVKKQESIIIFIHGRLVSGFDMVEVTRTIKVTQLGRTSCARAK